MLLRAPVQALKAGQVSKRAGHIVIAMRHYPRYTPKDLSHEYVRALAPSEELFSAFQALDRKYKDHNRAFLEVDYERRFRLEGAGERELERLAALARSKDVYLICQCTYEERCHGDLLLLTARARYGAFVGAIPFEYSVFASGLFVNN